MNAKNRPTESIMYSALLGESLKLIGKTADVERLNERHMRKKESFQLLGPKSTVRLSSLEDNERRIRRLLLDYILRKNDGHCVKDAKAAVKAIEQRTFWGKVRFSTGVDKVFAGVY